MSSFRQDSDIAADRLPIGILAATKTIPIRCAESQHIVGKLMAQHCIGQGFGIRRSGCDGEHVDIRVRIPVSPRQGAKQPQAAFPVLNDQFLRFLLQFRKALFKFVLPQLCQ